MFQHLFSLDPNLRLSQYRIDSWTAAQGLPSPIITNILQSRDGLIWLATFDGLAVFDGVRFRTYSSQNVSEMKNNVVMCLYEGSDGRIWAGTWGGGLLSIDHDRFHCYTTKNGLADNKVRDIVEGEKNELWIATNNGLNRMSNNRFSTFSEKEGLPIRQLKSLFWQSKNHTLWLGGVGGLYKLQNNRFQMIPHAGFDKNQPLIYKINMDRNSTLLAGGIGGLYKVDLNSLIFHSKYPNRTDSYIREIVIGKDKEVFIGGTLGIYRIDEFDIEKYICASLDNLNILSAIFDHEGNLWIGTEGGSKRDGLFRISDPRLISFASEEGINSDWTLSLLEQQDRNFLIGTKGGIWQIRKGGISIWEPAINTSGEVSLLYMDSNSNIWVGKGRNLFLFSSDGGSYRLKYHWNFNGVLTGFEEERERKYWIATTSGLFLLDYKGNSTEDMIVQKKNGSFSACGRERKGYFWFASYGQGLLLLDGGNWREINIKAGLSSDTVYTYYKDEEGMSWIGTNSGLNRWQNGKVAVIGSRQGLVADMVYSILEDEAGNFWMSSDNGIQVVSKQQLNEVADGMREKVEVRHYTENDGMRSRVCNGELQGAALRASDGRFWFASYRGAVVVDPDDPHWLQPPKARLLEVSADRKPVVSIFQEMPKKLVIPPGKKRFDFSYTGFPLADAEKQQFQYRLRGFDSGWIDAGSRREAGYTNLAPGDYTFEVRVRSGEGVWSEKPAAVEIRFQAFIYQQTWFRILAGLLIMTLAYYLIHLARKYIRMLDFWRRRYYVGHYKLLESIGGGGMGSVYRAVDNMAPYRQVALKVLKEKDFANAEQKKRFKKEAMIIEKLDHPHIRRIIERGEIEQDQMIYMAMELLEGETLFQRLQRDERMELALCMHIMVQTAQVIADIHKRSIIHRDLKPHNIMLVEEPGNPCFVKLIDFGVAVDFNQSRMTESGVIVGTLRYMPPETINDGIVSAAGDVYSMGVIFYEMLTGDKPFSGESAVEILSQILKFEVRDPIEVRPEIPQALSDLVLEMLHRIPENRPASTDILMQLKNVQMQEALFPDL